MKRRFISSILILCLVMTLIPSVALAVTAAPSTTSFVMNGKPVSVTAAYVINNTNYLQLRAIAAMLNGTAAQFDVGWDGQYAVIDPGKSYSGMVTETKLQNTTDVRQSNTKFKLNNEVFTFADARLINGDTNYIQLREFAQKMTGTASQFNVYWDSAAGQAVIQPGVAYTGNAPQSASTKPTGGSKRTINLDNLLTLEISHSYAYARLLGYDPSGANIIHNVIVPEGAEIKLTKYVPPFDNEYWQNAQYMIAPYSNIYFETGALWPSVTYAIDYDNWERAYLSEGSSITAANGHEYSFDVSTDNKSILSKYGRVNAAFYVIRIFVVPNDIAPKIGGTAPKILDNRSQLQEYSVPKTASSTPVTYVIDPNSTRFPGDGWYELLYDHVDLVLGLGIDAKGNAELGQRKEFFVEDKGNNQVTLRLADGRYLGIDGKEASGARVKAVNSPYLWNIIFENNGGFFDNNRYSFRPPSNTGLVFTASGTIKEGTQITLTSQKSMDASKNAEFTLFPTDMPANVSWVLPTNLEDGIYYIKAAKNENFVVDVNKASLEDGEKLILYQNNGGDNQKFKLTKVKDNQFTIQSLQSGMWWKSKKQKGEVLVQSSSKTDSSAITFTLIRQSDGTYRIMDSTGLYVGISGANMRNDTNIILWTEASDASQAYRFEKIK